MTLRSSTSELGVVNWHRLLWQVTFNPHQTLPLGLALLERDLFRRLHHLPRDDNNMVVAVVRTWALARALLDREQGHLPLVHLSAFDTLADNDFEPLLARFCAWPVDLKLVPPIYRLPPPLGMTGTDLTDEAVLMLFARWHERVFLQELAKAQEVCGNGFGEVGSGGGGVKGPENTVKTRLTDEDFRLLDRILGLEHIPLHRIFAQASTTNTFTLIKRSGLSIEKMEAAAGAVFDHDPATYNADPLGQILILARQYGIALLVNDEILFPHADTVIWLIYSAQLKKLVLVRDATAHILPINPTTVSAMLERWSRDRGAARAGET